MVAENLEASSIKFEEAKEKLVSKFIIEDDLGLYIYNYNEDDELYKYYTEVRDMVESISYFDGYTYFSQHDSRWDKIGQSLGLPADYVNQNGCGPTSLTMVLHYYYPNSEENPATILKWEKDCGNFPNQQAWGDSPKLFAEKFNLNYEVIPYRDKDKILNHLKQGHMVVFNVGKGIAPHSTYNWRYNGKYNTFTYSGHFMVMAGLTEKGNIKILDPANEEHTNNPNWTWEDIEAVPSTVGNQQWAFWR